MNALDSHLEALAFNYLSHGLLTIVNNIWTWVAVLTAAVSFWRIRSSSEHLRGKIIHGSSQNLLLSSKVERVVVGEPVNILEPEESISTPKTVLERQGSTKGKFTLYYCNEDESEECGTSGNHRARLLAPPMSESGYDVHVYGDENKGEKVGEGWWSKWEMVMKMRSGDDEWYCYQDLDLINGKVVRLWDGCRPRRNEAAPLELAVVGDFTW